MFEQFAGVHSILVELRFKAPPRRGFFGRVPPHVCIDSHSAANLARVQQEILGYAEDFGQATQDLRLGFPKTMLVSVQCRLGHVDHGGKFCLRESTRKTSRDDHITQAGHVSPVPVCSSESRPGTSTTGRVGAPGRIGRETVAPADPPWSGSW